MRLLHARHGGCLPRDADGVQGARAGAHRRRHGEGPGRQHLPLHRLPLHHGRLQGAPASQSTREEQQSLNWPSWQAPGGRTAHEGAAPRMLIVWRLVWPCVALALQELGNPGCENTCRKGVCQLRGMPWRRHSPGTTSRTWASTCSGAARCPAARTWRRPRSRSALQTMQRYAKQHTMRLKIAYIRIPCVQLHQRQALKACMHTWRQYASPVRHVHTLCHQLVPCVLCKCLNRAKTVCAQSARSPLLKKHRRRPAAGPGGLHLAFHTLAAQIMQGY